jgi:PadR family transcriptional regulator, regulatory protein PadR
MVMGGTQLTPHDSLSLELRRGALVLAVLVELRHEEYGYSLKKLLADKGLDIDEGTLYPLLRRLEAQGLLRSAWRVEDGRPRRYYQASAQGEKLAKELTAEWRKLAGVMGRLIG